MNDAYVIEWSFKPSDLFEQELQFDVLGALIAIENGGLRATIPPTVYEAHDSLVEALHEHLSKMIRGAQLVARCETELSEPTITRVYPDGRRGIYLRAKCGVGVCVGHAADFVLTRADGTKIDTKADRLEVKRTLANKAAEFGSDPHLALMLDSFDRAMSDKANMLVHLYEVCDALAHRVGSQRDARKKLHISKLDWSELSRIANDAPLREGRHRGKMARSLRSASTAELDHCKSIAASLISTYIGYLESKSK